MTQTKRRPFVISLAAFQLVVQGVGGGLVGWVHARERSSAPAAIEAQHGSACVVLHDALRCAVCQLVGLRVAAKPCRVQAIGLSAVPFPAAEDRAPATRIPYRPPSRAPPASLS